MTPAKACGCQIVGDGSHLAIIAYCPLHTAAPDMLLMLQMMTSTAANNTVEMPHPMRQDIKELIKIAEGKAFKPCCKLHAAAPELLEACKSVAICFKALCEQWATNDGRVVSDSGVVIDASKDVRRLCEIAAQKVIEAIERAEGEK